MIIKYFGSGKSSAGAVEYVEKNQTAKTLKGDNDITRDLISSNTNKLKYRSGVISFGADKPTKKQINEIIELFEKSTFAGLEEDQYNILWVEHTDNPKNYHIHFVIPRLELTTMKSFNPHYHKADQKRLLLLQKYINNKYNLINPFEVDRRQTLQLNTNWKNRNQAKERIDKIVTESIINDKIHNRQELVSFLQENGLQVKISKNYIAIKTEQDKKFIRLKGAYYNENYTSNTELGEELKRQERLQTATDGTKEELDRLIKYKAKQVQKRYAKKVKYSDNSDINLTNTTSNTNTILKEKDDTDRTTTTRSTRDSRTEEQELIRNSKAVRERIHIKYENNANEVDRDIKKYSNKARREQQTNLATATNATIVQYSNLTTIKTITARAGELATKIKDQVQKTYNEISTRLFK